MVQLQEALSKRERVARYLHRGRVPALLSCLPAKDSLLVLTYHRIGDAEKDPWDPAVFSATAEEFEEQVAYLRRKDYLVTLEEALQFVEGTSREEKRFRVLLTFDDGYLDNFETAFPILRSHGAQGVFFLCSGLAGSNFVPWWDKVAYMVKNGRRRRFSLTYPIALDIDLERDGLTASLRNILNAYKSQEGANLDRYLDGVREAADSEEVGEASRRFLNWEEAREMLAGGMAIGAHTHSHAMLSKLPVEEQRNELEKSRSILGENLGSRIDSLAYPFGTPNAFTSETKRVARETGFRAAFSYYGSQSNRPGAIDLFNVKRVNVNRQSFPRFQVQTGASRVTGDFWP